MTMVTIAASILSADFLRLAQEIESVEKAGADKLHIDVMDGHFVPNLTLGPMIIKAISRKSAVPLDVHLMITNASCYVRHYKESGADLLTVHAEASLHLDRDVNEIKSLGMKAGVALNPSTHENVLEYVIKDLDVVLVMSVNPGFGGQRFLPAVLNKIASIKTMLERHKNTTCILSVDGGITDKTAPACIKAGATCLVSGSYIFNSSDYKKAIESLRLAVPKERVI